MKSYYPIVFFILLCNSSCFGQKDRSASVDSGAREAQLAVYTYDEIAPLLEKKTDTTYVINFWATWCMPCVKELPYFERVSEQHKDKKVKFLLVSMDMESQIEKRLIPFLKAKKIKNEVVVLDDPDADSWIQKVDQGWSGAIPATLIYRKDQRAFFEQSFTYKSLQDEVAKFL